MEGGGKEMGDLVYYLTIDLRPLVYSVASSILTRHSDPSVPASFHNSAPITYDTRPLYPQTKTPVARPSPRISAPEVEDEVGVGLIGLVGVIAATLFELFDDDDGDDDTIEECDTVTLAAEPAGRDEDTPATGDVALVPPAPGPVLILTPALPQSCCAKAMTSVCESSEMI